MKIGSWAGLMLAATLGAGFLTGCGDFWQDPSKSSSTSFTLSNSGNITVAQGSSGTSTITVTPGSSFTGTVTLSCAITSSPSSATSPATCGLSSSSLTFSGTTAQTSTLTAYTTGTTTLGAYNITVTGVSGSVAETTVVCAEVGTGTCSSTASTSGKFYILNSTTISGYSISGSNLNPLSGSPTSLPTGYTPYSMAVDPTGSFLYVGTNGGILLYHIGTGGTLSLDSSFNLGDLAPYALQVDSTGQWLLDASNITESPTLNAWPISTVNGRSTLAGGLNVPTMQLVSGGSVGLGGLAISPDHHLVAVAVGSATEIFPFTAGNGNTGITNPFSTGYKVNAVGAAAISVAFDTQTRFLYIGETSVPGLSTSGGLRMIPISSDVVGNEASGSPYASGGSGPYSIVASSNGYVYVANWSGTSAGNITGFLLNASSSSLTPQSNPAATGNLPNSMALDSTGDFMLVVNKQGTPTFNAYTFDSSTTGKLDSLLTGSTGDGPIAIVAVP